MAESAGGCRRIPCDTLTDFCIEAMVRCGLSEPDARVAADVLVTTDLWGVYTHGTRALHRYMVRVRSGGLRANARPQAVAEGPAWARFDADNALSMVSSCRAMDLAIDKARQAGVGFVTVFNSSHFGAAGYYACMAVKHDMIGLAMSNGDVGMFAPGGRGKVIGNNPFAFAAPAGRERPIMLDMALSVVAAGKIGLAAAAGKRVPDTWLVDENGRPTTDPTLYPARATLAPVGGHKGYGLALMVETLAAALPGAGMLGEVLSWWMHDAGSPTRHGAAFVAINVAAIASIAEYKARMDRMIRQIRESPKAEGSNRIYLPGEIEWDNRDRAMAEGIALPQECRGHLRALADELGMKADWLSA